MLILPQKQHGFTLLEIIIGLAVFAILIALGAPSFSTWIQNTRIRTTANALQDGLQLARGTAVQSNQQVRFQLFDTLTNACALSTTSANWVVSLDDASGACASTNMYSDPTPVAPRMVQSRPTAEGSTNVTVAAGQNPIVFNSLGRQSTITGVTPNPPVDVTIDVSSAVVGTRNLRIIVTSGGQVRMCDPNLASTDPQGC